VKLSRGVRLLVIILIVSVGINMFLAGNQLGLWFHHPAPMNFEQRLETLLRELPEADRSNAQAILDAHRQDLLDKLRLYRQSALAAATAVHAETFDADDARAAFAKANGNSAEFRQALQDMVIEIAGKISPKGREHLRAGIAGP
jgi:uncharacterized membrane protein